MRAYCSWTVIGMVFLLMGCSEDSGGSGGQVVDNSTILMSTSLSTNAARLGGLATDTACEAAELSCTPTNLSGRIFAAGALLGNDSDGSKNYNMTFLADSLDIINRPDLNTHPEGTTSFDLSEPSTFSGLISIPTETGMPTNPVITRLETAFDYIDATVTLSGTANIDGTYVVRTVMRASANATDTDGMMSIGDKLIREDEETEFRWCASDGCTYTTRPSSPIQDTTILEADTGNDSEPGNQNYVYYSIDLLEEVTTTYAELSDTTRLWTVDYDVTDALSFDAAPSTFDSELDLVMNFALEYGCNFSGCETSENRVHASLTIGEAGTATE